MGVGHPCPPVCNDIVTPGDRVTCCVCLRVGVGRGVRLHQAASMGMCSLKNVSWSKKTASKSDDAEKRRSRASVKLGRIHGSPVTDG